MTRGKQPCVDQYAIGGAIAIASAAGGDGGPPRVIQLFKMGAHPSRNGKPPVIRVDDRAHAERIVAATARYHSSNDMVIDYDHQSVFGARHGVGGRAPAAGWSGRVFATDDGVFAEVDWTEAAATALGKREYRYISPVFTHDKAGRPLFVVNATLTNTPSLDLAAVASALSTEEGSVSMNLANIAKALGLGEDASEEEILRAIANATGAATMTAIATALGVAEGDDLVAAATALKEKADNAANPDPAKFVPVETVAQLTTSVQSLQGTVDGLQADRRKAKIDAAQSDGRLPPALVAHASSITDEAQLDAFLGALPAGGLGKAAVSGEPGSASGKLDAAELAVASAMGLTEEEFIAARGDEQEGTN
ncbi:phage protease [Sphingopyxis alaskensis]|uniref:phage protease n=1 Tax=Sphingopyxis alaskensis TaxID=117207 RepID=UPI00203B01C4|nr:phage protease [Sphingopyxis alaskensis]